MISQAQNWVWLVGPRGGIVAQGGMVDLPSELREGRTGTGSYCGRTRGSSATPRPAARSGWRTSSGSPRAASASTGSRPPSANGNQIHPDWYLGTNFDQSHGCIRLSKQLSLKVWNFTSPPDDVRVV